MSDVTNYSDRYYGDDMGESCIFQFSYNVMEFGVLVRVICTFLTSDWDSGLVI